MALPEVGQASYPTTDELRDLYLRTIKLAYQRRGLTANVLPDSAHYIRAQALAEQMSIAIANNRLALRDFSPLTAVGDALEALSNFYGVPRRPSSAGAGYANITCSGTVIIPQGYQCTAPDGTKYQTSSVNNITTSGSVAIVAVSGGISTNQDPGTVLTWDSASLGNLQRTAIVDDAGITDGVDEDDDETLRGRLIDRLSFPSVGGNWSQVKEWAEDASAAVQHAFVYAAAQGPSSCDVAIVGEGGDRTVTTATLNAVATYITSNQSGAQYFNVTTVTPQEVDIVLSASLPLPTNAGGAGGGWRDATPWPSTNVKVTAYNSSTDTITVDAVSPDTPVVGNNIGIWDPTAAEPTMREYAVSSVGGSSGAYTITVQGGFGFTPTGAYVSAGAVKLVDYADAAKAQFETLGPGEKTSNIDILNFARRRPGADVEAPMALTNVLLSGVIQSNQEILNLEYAARYETGTTTTITTADVAAAVADPPNILVLKHLAIRKAS